MGFDTIEINLVFKWDDKGVKGKVGLLNKYNKTSSPANH